MAPKVITKLTKWLLWKSGSDSRFLRILPLKVGVYVNATLHGVSLITLLYYCLYDWDLTNAQLAFYLAWILVNFANMIVFLQAEVLEFSLL